MVQNRPKITIAANPCIPLFYQGCLSVVYLPDFTGTNTKRMNRGVKFERGRSRDSLALGLVMSVCFGEHDHGDD